MTECTVDWNENSVTAERCQMIQEQTMQNVWHPVYHQQGKIFSLQIYHNCF